MCLIHTLLVNFPNGLRSLFNIPQLIQPVQITMFWSFISGSNQEHQKQNKKKQVKYQKGQIILKVTKKSNTIRILP